MFFISIIELFKRLTRTTNKAFWSEIKYFEPSEFDEKSKEGKGTGLKYMREDLIRKLDKARTLAGFPFHVNSGYRSPLYNERIGGVKDSEHIYGMAADIRFEGYNEFKKLHNSLVAVGFKRLGFYINPLTNTGFIHAGISKTHPQTNWFRVYNQQTENYERVSTLNDVTKNIS